MTNIIYTDMDEAIGFYKDLKQVFLDEAKAALEEGDWENALSNLQYIEEMFNDYHDYKGLLVVSENNGMGFTCKPWEAAKGVE